MSVFAAYTPPPTSDSVLDRLSRSCREQGLESAADRLADLERWIGDELQGIEAELELLPRGSYAVHACARHLVGSGGKHLRPMCVALAAKLGSGFGDEARNLAIAVELIHDATLLHDDVIDQGERRRGLEAARVIHGNAASVIGGDWLLVEALKRVRAAGVPGVLDHTLDTLSELVEAEAIQIEHRGQLNGDREAYERVIAGKTASLFRLALFAGAAAGGLEDDQRQALDRYGLHLGMAFQLIDDLLDVAGDPERTGKALFQDLREGKMNHALLIALERDPALAKLLRESFLDPVGDPPSRERVDAVRKAVAATDSIAACQTAARRHAREAIASLTAIPAGRGRAALFTVAEATVYRRI